VRALESLTTFNQDAAAGSAEPERASPRSELFVQSRPPVIDRRREQIAAREERLEDGAAVDPSHSAPAATMDLERLIGMRWFAAIGAVVVVIGVGLFLKLAYDQGWMRLIPPEMKCVLGAAFGLALVGAGEVIRTRVNALGSMGISAAGLGALYASGYSAYGVYGLVPPSLAFVLLMLVSGLGFVVSARADVALLAVLSIVAAYLNPFVVGGPGSPLVLPVYLLAVLAVGLTLSAWRPRPFRVLRPLVWWGSVLLGSFWTLTAGVDEPDLALGFIAVFWAAVHAELGLSARASGRVLDEDTVIELTWADARFVGTSFSSTIWAAVLAVVVVRSGAAVGDWMPPAAGAAAAILTSLVLAGHLRVLRDVPRTDAQRLGAGLAMQGGALLIAAVSLATAGWTETLAWLAMGVGAVGTGRWIRSRGLDIYGVVLLAVGGVRLVVVDSPLFGPAIWAYEVGGIVISHWTLLMLAGAAAWGSASALLLRFAPVDRVLARWWRAMGSIAAVGSLAMVLVSFLQPRADAGSVALAWFAVALLAAAWARGRVWAPVVVASGVGMAIANGMALLSERIALDLGGEASVYARLGGIVVTRWMLVVLAAGGAWAALAAILDARGRGAPRASGRGSDAAVFSAWVAAALVYASLVREVSGAASVAWVWMGMSLMLVMMRRVLPRYGLDAMGTVGLVAAVGAWGAAYAPGYMTGHAPLAHPGLWLGLALAGACALAYVWIGRFREFGSEPRLRGFLAFLGVVLLFGVTSLEVARATGLLADDPTVRRAAVSLWWGCYAVGLLAAGFARRAALVRHAGLALLAVATAKAAIVDLAEVPQLWRVASFIGLGLLMLGVAVAYARATARLKPA
jgi:uncharacterized membrane protein